MCKNFSSSSRWKKWLLLCRYQWTYVALYRTYEPMYSTVALYLWSYVALCLWTFIPHCWCAWLRNSLFDWNWFILVDCIIQHKDLAKIWVTSWGWVSSCCYLRMSSKQESSRHRVHADNFLATITKHTNLLSLDICQIASARCFVIFLRLSNNNYCVTTHVYSFVSYFVPYQQLIRTVCST